MTHVGTTTGNLSSNSRLNTSALYGSGGTESRNSAERGRLCFERYFMPTANNVRNLFKRGNGLPARHIAGESLGYLQHPASRVASVPYSWVVWLRPGHLSGWGSRTARDKRGIRDPKVFGVLIHTR